MVLETIKTKNGNIFTLEKHSVTDSLTVKKNGKTQIYESMYEQYTKGYILDFWEKIKKITEPIIEVENFGNSNTEITLM